MLRKNYEVGKELTLLEIKGLREVADLCDDVAVIVKKFDGKVFNIRFKKKLEEYTQERFSVSKSFQEITDNNEEYYRRLDIQYWLKNIYVKSGEYTVEYLLERSKTITIYSDTNEKAPIIEKRLVAENILPAIERQKEKFLEKAKELEEGIAKVHEWDERLNAIRDEYSNVKNEIPYELIEYFGIKVIAWKYL